jgi:hypothetical protein
MFNKPVKILKFILFGSNGFLSDPSSTGKSMEIMMPIKQCCDKNDQARPERKRKNIIYCC